MASYDAAVAKIAAAAAASSGPASSSTAAASAYSPSTSISNYDVVAKLAMKAAAASSSSAAAAAAAAGPGSESDDAGPSYVTKYLCKDNHANEGYQSGFVVCFWVLDVNQSTFGVPPDNSDSIAKIGGMEMLTHLTPEEHKYRFWAVTMFEDVASKLMGCSSAEIVAMYDTLPEEDAPDYAEKRAVVEENLAVMKANCVGKTITVRADLDWSTYSSGNLTDIVLHEPDARMVSL